MLLPLQLENNICFSPLDRRISGMYGVLFHGMDMDMDMDMDIGVCVYVDAAVCVHCVLSSWSCLLLTRTPAALVPFPLGDPV